MHVHANAGVRWLMYARFLSPALCLRSLAPDSQALQAHSTTTYCLLVLLIFSLFLALHLRSFTMALLLRSVVSHFRSLTLFFTNRTHSTAKRAGPSKPIPLETLVCLKQCLRARNSLCMSFGPSDFRHPSCPDSYSSAP